MILRDGTKWNNQQKVQRHHHRNIIIREMRFHHQSDDRLLHLVFSYKANQFNRTTALLICTGLIILHVYDINIAQICQYFLFWNLLSLPLRNGSKDTYIEQIQLQRVKYP